MGVRGRLLVLIIRKFTGVAIVLQQFRHNFTFQGVYILCSSTGSLLEYVLV